MNPFGTAFGVQPASTGPWLVAPGADTSDAVLQSESEDCG